MKKLRKVHFQHTEKKKKKTTQIRNPISTIATQRGHVNFSGWEV